MASPGFGVHDRGAEVGSGMGVVFPPSRLGSLGGVVSSPIWVRGGAPAAIAFSACFRPPNASGSKKIRIPL